MEIPEVSAAARSSLEITSLAAAAVTNRIPSSRSATSPPAPRPRTGQRGRIPVTGNDVEGVEALRLRLPHLLPTQSSLSSSTGGTAWRPGGGPLERTTAGTGSFHAGSSCTWRRCWRPGREESREQDEEDDAAGPEVGHGAVVAFLPEDLRCHVGRSTAGSVEEAVGAEVVGEGAETKVGNLETSSAVEKEVLGLQIPVVDAAGMAEIDSGDELPEVLARDLHGEVDLRLGGHHLVELHDVRVSNHLHHGDLPLHLLHHPGLDHLLLADHLHGYAPAAADVPREVDFPEGAMAEETPHLVLALEDNNLATGGHRWRRDLLHRRRSKTRGNEEG
ncbi:unnamed protein product [Spirodela intermedia]|uniref:Uncharacterized protein n=1 Tax=Spirodela intermedia TaxID=51605 RepID=A0A7I8JLM2_SPIIN|nr:unnamed protein product [Spirodela intermedia]CAA6670980.1 unnamed protein product [Spirodela intermedia]